MSCQNKEQTCKLLDPQILTKWLAFQENIAARIILTSESWFADAIEEH